MKWFGYINTLFILLTLASCSTGVYYEPPISMTSLASITGSKFPYSSSDSEILRIESIDGIPLYRVWGPAPMDPTPVTPGVHWIELQYDAYFWDTLWGLIGTHLTGKILIELDLKVDHKYVAEFTRQGKLLKVWVKDITSNKNATQIYSILVSEPQQEPQQYTPMILYNKK